LDFLIEHVRDKGLVGRGLAEGPLGHKHALVVLKKSWELRRCVIGEDDKEKKRVRKGEFWKREKKTPVRNKKKK
jgi:hypothetical protein